MTENLFKALRMRAVAWKKPVFLSPSASHSVLLRCREYSSSSLYASLSARLVSLMSSVLSAELVIASSNCSLSFLMVAWLF